MTLHDAAIMHFSQWWKRNVRNGHAYAEGAAMHGNTPARHWVRQARSNWVWGLIFPVLVLLVAWPTRGISLVVLLLIYWLQYTRIQRSEQKRGRFGRDSRLYAAFCVIGKFAQAQGQLRYVTSAMLGRRRTLIEYKSEVPRTSNPTAGAL
jgi:hypothetical protein